MEATATLVVLLSAGLTALKILAFCYETIWAAFRAKEVLLPIYHSHPFRTQWADTQAGRPRIFDAGLGDPDASRPRRMWSVVFRAPVILTIHTAVVIVMAPAAGGAALVFSAVCAALLGLFVVLGPVVSRLAIGPYDTLNPDLIVARPVAKYLYHGRRSSVALYMLVLLGFTVVAFTTAYTALGGVDGLILSPGETSTDPIGWLYSAVSISATEGLGQAEPQTGWVQMIVVMQMAMGPLVLAWVASTYFGDRLPPEVETRFAELERRELSNPE